jgi:hypothetical protein
MAIPLHVWLQLYDDLYALPQIIDITADQGVGIHETVLLGTGYKLSKEKGLVYLVGNLFRQQYSDRKVVRWSRLPRSGQISY